MSDINKPVLKLVYWKEKRKNSVAQNIADEVQYKVDLCLCQDKIAYLPSFLERIEITWIYEALKENLSSLTHIYRWEDIFVFIFEDDSKYVLHRTQVKLDEIWENKAKLSFYKINRTLLITIN